MENIHCPCSVLDSLYDNKNNLLAEEKHNNFPTKANK